MDQSKPVQAGSLLLPPATNWFCSASVDSREEDRLLVAGAFKNIVVYKIPLGSEAPTVLKNIYHLGPKVLHVRLFPDASHQRHGPSLLASSDVGDVTLYNVETGVASLQHNEHEAGEVHGVCWLISSCSNEVSAVSVGAAGTLVVWDVDLNITRKVYINPSQRSNVPIAPQPDVTLTLVEAVPGVDNTVVVAAQKVIVIVDIKSGRVLSQLRGHDHPVFCLQWWTPTHPSATSPFPHPRPVNARAEALRDNDGGAAATAVAEEPESSTVASARYFASSDLGGSVLLWDVDRRRYVYRTQVSSSTHKGSGRGYRSSPQHCALAWRDNELLTNTVSGIIVSLPLSENSSASCVSVNHESSAPPQQKHSDGWRSGSSSWRSNNAGPERKSPVLENGGYELRPKVIHREHSRVVFNLNLIGSTLVSCGHDRNLIGYSLDSNKLQFSLPTLGGSVHSIAFDPRDSSWLALGSQEDCIRLIKLNSSPPLRSKVISNGIRGKVLALSWHPKEDGFLLYGTSEGQVGIANVNTTKVTSFSFFHQKPVYKVEWAPAMLANEYPDYAKTWCAYSFGDREIAMRNPNTPMADPVKLSKVSRVPGHASEFAFSHDHKYFAVGCQDGTINVYRSADLAILVKIVVVRKTIQHLLWKPFLPSGNAEQNTPYVLAVASSESRICLLDLTNTLPEQSSKFDNFQVAIEQENDSVDVAESAEAEPDLASWKPMIVSTCTRELCGHSSRVVYLSFSVCEPDLLASASYDHTCQVWDSNSGEQIGNYRAHLSKLYRVEFSPSEPGLLFSFGEENCVHQWKLADLTEKSPPEKVLKVKDNKPKLAVAHENEEKCVAISPSPLKSSETKPKNAKHTETSSAVTSSRRVPTHKSLFPLLHQASCHKRSFNLLSVLCLDEQSKLVKEQAKLAKEVSVEQIIAASETDDDNCDYPFKPLESASVHYGAAVDAVGDAVFDADDPAPPADDLRTFVDFYGPTLFTRQFLSKQINSHLVASNFAAAAPLELWCGTSDSLLRSAIAKKSVTPDLVVQAMHSSRQSGVLACAAYARQLIEAGDPLTASSYFIMANMDLEAIELLQQHKLFREALILAKARRPCSSELHESIARSFAGHCMHEGNLDIAAVLLASVGDAAEAAAMLCRRGDPASLAVAGLLYSRHGHALADATLLEALRTAGYRGQLDKVLASVLKVAPQYKWFSLIAATVREITALFAAVKAQSGEDVLINSKSRSSDSVSQDGAPDGKTERVDSSSTFGVPDDDCGGETQENMSNSRTPSEKEASSTIEDEGETCDHRSLETKVNGVHTASVSGPGLESCSTQRVLKKPAYKTFFVSSEDGEDEDVMQRIISVWPRELRTYDAHASICSALSVSLKPSTLKQYVFLLSVELTKMLLCLDACIAAVEGDTAAVKGDTAAVKGDITAVEGDTAAIEEDIAAVKGDTAAVGDNAAVERDTAAVERDTAAANTGQGNENALDVEAAATALHSALQLAIDWNRFDQLFEVTHMLLPKGVDEPPALLSPLFNYGTALTPHSAAALLCKLYRLTEHAYLNKTSSNPHAPKEPLAENGAGSIHEGLDATGEDSSEVNPSNEATDASDIISSHLVSSELENGGSCGDEMVSLAREVAESCGAGDDAKVKRIFDDISFLLCNVKIQ